MCFPCRFLFSRIFFLPFFYFPVSFWSFLRKMTKKKRKFPTLRYERIICVIFALLCERISERIICVRMRKNYLRHYAKELFAFVLRSQHSLDIFHISRSGACGSLFLALPFYFYIEIKR